MAKTNWRFIAGVSTGIFAAGLIVAIAEVLIIPGLLAFSPGGKAMKMGYAMGGGY